jgi:hypothetical protein
MVAPTFNLQNLDAMALALSCVGMLCWAMCFWWMHRISSRQDALLKERLGRRLTNLTRVRLCQAPTGGVNGIFAIRRSQFQKQFTRRNSSRALQTFPCTFLSQLS